MDRQLLKRFWPFLRRHRLWLAWLILMLLLIDCAAVLQPYLVKLGIDRAVVTGDDAALNRLVGLLVAIMLLSLAVSAVFQISIMALGQQLLKEIRSRMHAQLLRLPAAYLDKTPAGRILTYLTSDVEAVRQFISEGLVSVIGDLLKVVIILGAMVLINWRLALLVFLTIPLFLTVTALFRRSIRSGYRGVRQANAQLNTQVEETISGITEIHQFDCAAHSRRQFDQVNRTYLQSFMRVVVAYAVYFPMIELVSTLALCITLFAGHHGMNRFVQVGEMFAFFTYIHMFFRPLRQLAENFNTFQSAMAAAERIFSFLDEPLAADDGNELPGWTEENLIELRRLSFAYRADEPVLHDISLTVRRGETVALVGVTGSGKTTLVKLLVRLYESAPGQIRLAGRDIQTLDIRALRSMMAIVTQESILFSGTVAENITLFDSRYSPQQVAAVADQVGLAALLSKRELGLDTMIENGGENLSFGEMQLIAYARALLRNPAILILDEATSRVDAETEKLIEAATRQAISGRTTILIAHRLSTIHMADRILFLHQGRLHEQGNHEQLMSQNGLYARLYRLQRDMLG